MGEERRAAQCCLVGDLDLSIYTNAIFHFDVYFTRVKIAANAGLLSRNSQGLQIRLQIRKSNFFCFTRYDVFSMF